VKTSDVVIIGGGVIGLSLACDLRRHGVSAMVLDKHQPGREASWAAGGMIAYCEAGRHPLFRRMAEASARLYPAFAHTLEDESRTKIDLRQEGTIRFVEAGEQAPFASFPIPLSEVRELEPALEYTAPAVLLPEACVDPRLLITALLKLALHLGVELVSGADVTHLEVLEGRAVSAITTKTRYFGDFFVNCAGAWAGQFSPVPVRTIPVKGQMLAVVPERRRLIKHVIRGNGVYLIPRKDGRIVIGSTVEDVGFDKRISPVVIQHMHQAAAMLVPELGEARILEDWAGLRPGTPDKLPIMGRTSVGGYLVATGHFRDGILLAPITARLMSQVIRGERPEIDFDDFSPARFGA
jgi:glycine oxidase ThiO